MAHREPVPLLADRYRVDARLLADGATVGGVDVDRGASVLLAVVDDLDLAHARAVAANEAARAGVGAPRVLDVVPLDVGAALVVDAVPARPLGPADDPAARRGEALRLGAALATAGLDPAGVRLADLGTAEGTLVLRVPPPLAPAGVPAEPAALARLVEAACAPADAADADLARLLGGGRTREALDGLPLRLLLLLVGGVVLLVGGLVLVRGGGPASPATATVADPALVAPAEPDVEDATGSPSPSPAARPRQARARRPARRRAAPLPAPVPLPVGAPVGRTPGGGAARTAGAPRPDAPAATTSASPDPAPAPADASTGGGDGPPAGPALALEPASGGGGADGAAPLALVEGGDEALALEGAAAGRPPAP